MLKDAILTMLDIDILLNRSGFSLKDFHFGNVLISRGKVFFVDFGSILRKNKSDQPEYLGEFIKYCFMPLYLWGKGDGYFATRILSDEFHERFFGIAYKVHIPYSMSLYLFFSKVRRYLNRHYSINLFSIFDLEFLRTQVLRLKMPVVDSAWASYHRELFEYLEQHESYPRYKKLAEVVREFMPRTILDLAGNAGFFSLVCSHYIDGIKNIYCCDCDHNAINFLYNFLKDSKNPKHKRITPIMMNIALPQRLIGGEDHYARLGSDVVCLLAATHHLLLTQHIDIDYIFSEVKKYVRKGVIIEYMPLGLFDGKDAPPLPSWYTREWFRKKFCQYFNIKMEIELEVNRIAFVGTI